MSTDGQDKGLQNAPDDSGALMDNTDLWQQAERKAADTALQALAAQVEQKVSAYWKQWQLPMPYVYITRTHSRHIRQLGHECTTFLDHVSGVVREVTRKGRTVLFPADVHRQLDQAGDVSIKLVEVDEQVKR